MFTGLVEGMVTLVERSVEGAGQALTFDLGPLAQGVQIGDSIALSGCCLTVIRMDGTRCTFELGSETLSRTLFQELAVGGQINCERSLRAGDRLGGHFVTGHVDAVGTVIERKDEGEWRFLHFNGPPGLMRHMAEKGSVAVDGVSLTIVQADDQQFSVALIPHTLEVTTLGALEKGSRVHLESDILAKYVARQLEAKA
ncbi:MAG: riboflavin synthase [Pirellula sp.]|nr:riboflavin synthase [Pirellula sp.]